MIVRRRNLAASLIALTFALALAGPAQGWGGDVHRLINRSAAEHLPEAFVAFANNTSTLVALSSAADDRKSSDDSEGIRHYIDIDDYPAFFSGTLPHAWDSIVALYGLRRVEGNGILPWTIEDSYATLVARFEARNWTGAVATAADIGHYVGDLHNPLHLTENFDGQLTGQDGIHSRYESRLTGRYLEYLTPRVFTPAYVADPLQSAFDWIDGQYPGVQLILNADRIALAESGSNRSDAYYAIMWTELGAETQDWIRAAALRVASLWYSAWLDAGAPILPGTTPVASLLAFTATPQPGAIDVAWTVADAGPIRFTLCRREGDGDFAPLPGAVVDNFEGVYPASFTWRDESVEPGLRYDYRLDVLLRDGARETWDRVAGAQAQGDINPVVQLLGANPVRHGGPLGVAVELAGAEPVRVALYDVTGRLVRVLQDGSWGPGRHTVELGSGERRDLRAGVYFLAVRGASVNESVRVVLLD